MRTRPGADQGFALILALWITIVLAVIGAGVLQLVRDQQILAATEIDTLKARLIADGGINRAILSVIDSNDTLRFRIDGTPQDVLLSGRHVTVSVTSESGKIDLNAAPASLLSSLLLTAGAPHADSDVIAGRIIAWRSPPPPVAVDLEAAAYKDSGRSYTPRRAPFRSVGELQLVLGMTDDLQAALAPLLTVYSNAATPDISVAGDDVLRALVAAGNQFAASQLAARAQGDAAGVDRLPAPGEALLIQARAVFGSAIGVRAAVIRPAPKPPLNYQVLEWD